MSDMFLDALAMATPQHVERAKVKYVPPTPEQQKQNDIVRSWRDGPASRPQRPINADAIDAIVADMVKRRIVALDDRTQRYVRGPAALWGE